MLRDHAPKKAGFQHWPVSVADFNSHGKKAGCEYDREPSRRGTAPPRSGTLGGSTKDQLLPSARGHRRKASDLARLLFGQIPGGWQRVQAICDYINGRIQFGYHHARCDRTASEGGHEERVGVCRDFAHLAIRLSMHEYPGPLLHSYLI
jgi:transglutaminase-like putative cysteine protease